MGQTAEQLVGRIEAALARLDHARARDAARLRALQDVVEAGIADLDLMLAVARR